MWSLGSIIPSYLSRGIFKLKGVVSSYIPKERESLDLVLVGMSVLAVPFHFLEVFDDPIKVTSGDLI